MKRSISERRLIAVALVTGTILSLIVSSFLADAFAVGYSVAALCSFAVSFFFVYGVAMSAARFRDD